MNKQDNKISVIAKEEFTQRRLRTIAGLKRSDFRKLKRGETIKIDRYLFDRHKDILQKDVI